MIVKENRVAEDVVEAAFRIHRALGPGLLESVYEILLAHELVGLGHDVERQRPVAIRYGQVAFDVGFRADMVVDGCVILELKAVEKQLPVHSRQLLTYIRAADMKLGMLVNFGECRMKDGITRVVNNLPDNAPSQP